MKTCRRPAYPEQSLKMLYGGRTRVAFDSLYNSPKNEREGEMRPKELTVSDVINDIGMTRYSWKVFYIIAFCSLMCGISYLSVPVTMPLIAQDWGLDSVSTGALSSWVAIGLMIGGAVGGIVTDKIGRRIVFVVSAVVLSVFTGCMFFVDNYTAFIILRIITGLFIGAFMPIQVAYVSEFVPTKRRATLVAFGCCFMPLGFSLASIIAIVMVPLGGWRAVYLVSFIGVLLGIVAYAKFPESPTWLVANNRADEACGILRKMAVSANRPDYKFEPEMLVPSALDMRDASAKKAGLRDLVSKDYAFSTVGFFLIYFFCMLSLYSINTWLPTLLMDRGFDLNESLGLSFLKDIFGMLGSVLAGFIINWMGRKKGTVFTQVFAFCTFCIMAFLTGNVVILYIGAVLVGFGTNLLPNPINIIAAECYPTNLRTTMNAWMSAFGRIASFLAPVLAGVLVGMNLDYSTVMILLVVPSIIAAILSMVFIRSETKGVRL